MTTPAVSVKDVRDALLAASSLLLKLDEKCSELGNEARMFRLFASVPLPFTWEGPQVEALLRMLDLFANTTRFLNNWTDCARGGTPSSRTEAFDAQYIEPAMRAVHLAESVLHAFVDEHFPA